MTAARTRILVGAVVVVALAVGLRLLPVADLLQRFQEYVAGRGAWGMVLYVLGYVAAALLFVPGALLTVGAGLVFGFWRGVIVVSIASTTAAALAFLIARYLARPAVERWAKNNERFRAVERAVAQRGAVVVLLLRLSPAVPFSLSNYLYGLTPVAFGTYVLASWIGMMPATALYVYLGSVGHALGEKRTPAEWLFLAAGIVATAAVTVFVGRAARKELETAAASVRAD
jgi:uncharacterized membrane protein YdjX (TVP38/TMEM64 family)